MRNRGVALADCIFSGPAPSDQSARAGRVEVHQPLVAPETLSIQPRASVLAGAATTRSHLADGRVVCWSPTYPPGTRIAVDAELVDQVVPAAMARRFGIVDPERFWPLWTAMEVACKLADVPVLRWLARHGLEGDLRGIQSAVLTHRGVVICCGAIPDPLKGAGDRS